MMCGVAGWVDFSPQSKKIVEKMTAALTHRGPDDEGIYYKGPVALGHRRLAIIDLAASLQPMISYDQRYVLTYNGEIYNFLSLRNELISLGHTFSTQGDTEVLLHALIEWKEGAISRLNGMFAFAFWDAQEEVLLLARDHFGVKPLYICQEEGRIIFGSEIKALLEHPCVSREVDPQAIGLYLECQYIPAPYTMFQKIRKLPAAHFLKWKQGKGEEKRYWNLSYLPKFEGDEEAALQQLEMHLRRSVRSMLVADVPLGAFVSGGIDSSLIAALMQAESGQSPKIFSIGLESDHSEHPHAARVASYLGAEFYPLIVTAQDLLGALDHPFCEPLGDQAILPTLLLSKWARNQVKVVLTGEGADEVFAGYTNYAKKLKEAPLAHLLHKTPLPYLYPFFPAKLRKNRLCKAMARPLSRRYTTIPSLFDREIYGSLLSRSFWAAQEESLERLAEIHYLDCDSDHYLDRMLHIDKKLWLADDLLAKVDRSTMVHSLEARVPFLDHQLVEFVARLPTDFKLRAHTAKYLLRKVAGKGLLPPEIFERPKWGFYMPLKEWMAKELKPLVNDRLQSLERRNLFQPHLAKRKDLHATRQYALLSLELWFQKFAPNFAFSI